MVGGVWINSPDHDVGEVDGSCFLVGSILARAEREVLADFSTAYEVEAVGEEVFRSRRHLLLRP
jgi:hypothetical protein